MSKRFRKHKPSVREGSMALRDHVLTVADTARQRYGPSIDWPTMQSILQDRAIVRYPATVVFDDAPLHADEFAFAEPNGCSPSDGFNLYVHPCFESTPDVLPMLVAYQLVRINYGDVASHEEAELFGSRLLGMPQDDYYETICRLADSIPANTAA